MILLSRTPPSPPAPKRRSLKTLLATVLADLDANSQHIHADCLGSFDAHGERYWLPRFVFRGDRTDEPPLKIGIFAGVHGDEVAGILACFDLLRFFEREPFLARAYHLHFYPLVNPTGFEDRTRHARSGQDLNRAFWRGSALPEVRIIEKEIQRQRFDGLISLHSDDTSEGLYGFVRGATLTEHLLKPALAAAEDALPINDGPLIDGFHAVNGIIRSCYDGVLSAPPDTRPSPFEIILESPQLAPIALQRQALALGVREIIREYRRLISFAANL